MPSIVTWSSAYADNHQNFDNTTTHFPPVTNATVYTDASQINEIAQAVIKLEQRLDNSSNANSHLYRLNAVEGKLLTLYWKDDTDRDVSEEVATSEEIISFHWYIDSTYSLKTIKLITNLYNDTALGDPGNVSMNIRLYNMANSLMTSNNIDTAGTNVNALQIVTLNVAAYGTDRRYYCNVLINTSGSGVHAVTNFVDIYFVY